MLCKFTPICIPISLFPHSLIITLIVLYNFWQLDRWKMVSRCCFPCSFWEWDWAWFHLDQGEAGRVPRPWNSGGAPSQMLAMRMRDSEWGAPRWHGSWARNSVLVPVFTLKPVQIHLATTTWTFHLKTVRNWVDYVLHSSNVNVDGKQQNLKRTIITLCNDVCSFSVQKITHATSTD